MHTMGPLGSTGVGVWLILYAITILPIANVSAPLLAIVGIVAGILVLTGR